MSLMSWQVVASPVMRRRATEPHCPRNCATDPSRSRSSGRRRSRDELRSPNWTLMITLVSTRATPTSRKPHDFRELRGSHIDQTSPWEADVLPLNYARTWSVIRAKARKKKPRRITPPGPFSHTQDQSWLRTPMNCSSSWNRFTKFKYSPSASITLRLTASSVPSA